jgi:FtsH-binding integral membrane protein
MSTVAIVVAVTLSFFLIILSGIWLSRTGRPLNVPISTIHKLISLAAGVYLLVVVFQHNQQVPLGPAEWIAVVVTGLCFLAMAATGGVLASDKARPLPLLRAHQIMPALTVVSTGATLYLLLA